MNSDKTTVSETIELTAAQRARAERQRLRASQLRSARLSRPTVVKCTKAIDSGGGFLLEEEPPSPERPRATPAPVVDEQERPHCLECGLRFAQSYLFDEFEYPVCDSCRDEEGEHSLMTRTEAKSEFLLKDCDLDLREPVLRCVRRRNPHRARFAEMRLYLRAQVRTRALEVWGTELRLAEERVSREERRRAGDEARGRRRLRELRLAARCSLLAPPRADHRHEWGAESRADDDDMFTRTCTTCGFIETYEKM